MKTIATLLLFILAASSSIAQTYSIGTLTTSFTLNGSPEVEADVYYPATSPGGVNAPVATPIDSIARFPVVVFGHGHMISVTAYDYLVQLLVPRGYIVVLPTGQAGSSPDIELFGAYLAAANKGMRKAGDDPSSPFYRKISPRSAIGGHSMGGAAAMFGVFHDSVGTVLFTLAPVIPPGNPSPINYLRNGRADVTALTIAGSNDCVAPPSQHALRIHDTIFSTCKTYATITGGSHCQFAAPNTACAIAERNCTPPSIILVEQQRVVDSLVLPWLDWKLKDRCEGLQRFKAMIDTSWSITTKDACTDRFVGFDLMPTSHKAICPGDSITLTAPGSHASTYLWSTGATTQSIVVKSPGVYSVRATNGTSCVLRSRPFTVDFASTPSTPITGNSIICPRDYVTLSAPSGLERYRWSTGDTTRSILVHQPGTYWVRGAIGDCWSTADTLEVFAAPDTIGTISIDGSTTLCSGESVRLSISRLYHVNPTWSNGSTPISNGHEIVVTEPGEYSVRAISTSGCRIGFDTVRVRVHATTSPVIVKEGSLLIALPQGGVSYQWRLDGMMIQGATDRSHAPTRPGRYTVTMLDSNGCYTTSPGVDVTVAGVETIEESAALRVAVDGGSLDVAFPVVGVSHVRIMLVDMSGRIVIEKSDRASAPSYSGTFDVSTLPRGVYVVVVDVGRTRMTRRVAP